MRVKSFFVLGCLIFLFTYTLIAQKRSVESPFFFIQMTDTQFGFIDKNESFEKETALSEKAVDEVNRLDRKSVV